MATSNPTTQHDQDVLIENIMRYTAQARSTLLTLAANDNFECLKPEDISNVLWLLGDRLDDIQKGADALWGMKPVQNSGEHKN